MLEAIKNQFFNKKNNSKLKKIFKSIHDYINKYENIVILHHVTPDPDCCGTQFGLSKLIKLNYQNKKVYNLGNTQKLNNIAVLKFDDISHFTDNDYKKSLIIIVDNHQWVRTNWKGFIDKEKIRNYIIIDHHIVDKNDPDNQARNANFYWIDPDASSTAELVATLMYGLSWHRDSEALGFLYWGILSDTGYFRFSCRSQTFTIVKKFYNEKGFKPERIVNLSSKSKESIVRLNGYILTNFIIDGSIAYSILEVDILKKYNADYQTSLSINALGNVTGVDQWVQFTAGAPNNKYRTEFRSSRYDMQSIAVKFGGGGHLFAAGAMINKEQIFEVIEAMKQDLDKRDTLKK